MSDFINSVCESIVNLFVDEEGILCFITVPLLALFASIAGIFKLFFSFFPAKKSESKDSELVVDIEQREYTKKLPKYNRK